MVPRQVSSSTYGRSGAFFRPAEAPSIAPSPAPVVVPSAFAFGEPDVQAREVQRLRFSLCLCLLLQACRVSLVTPLYWGPAEHELAERLVFQDTDPFGTGTLEAPLTFGFASSVFIPSEVTPLAGFGGGPRRHLPPQLAGLQGGSGLCLPYTRTEQPPRVKVALWRDALGQSFVLFGLDVVGTPADVTRKLLRELSASFPDLGLTHANFQVVASHTHAGPAGLTENPFWATLVCDGFSQPLWDEFLLLAKQTLASAVSAAAPADVTLAPGVMPEGLTRSRLGGMAPDTRTLVVEARGSRILLASFHPTYFGMTSTTLSADLAGFVEEAMGSQSSFFMNGSVGNVDANVSSPSAWAAEVAGSLPRLFSAPIGRLSYGAGLLPLPAPQVNFPGCRASFAEPFVSPNVLEFLPRQTKVAYLALGNTLLVFYPGEPVLAVSQALESSLRKRIPSLGSVYLVGLSNDYLGYSVDPGTYGGRSLEACSTLYDPQWNASFADWIVANYPGVE